MRTKMTSNDVLDYIARFNVALNRCSDVEPAEALFVFEQNLWLELQAQVLA